MGRTVKYHYMKNREVFTGENELVAAEGVEIDSGDGAVFRAEEFSTGHTGGDDSIHYIRLEDLAGAMEITDISTEETTGIELVIRGDNEMDALISALKYIVKELKKDRKETEAIKK